MNKSPHHDFDDFDLTAIPDASVPLLRAIVDIQCHLNDLATSFLVLDAVLPDPPPHAVGSLRAAHENACNALDVLGADALKAVPLKKKSPPGVPPKTDPDFSGPDQSEGGTL